MSVVNIENGLGAQCFISILTIYGHGGRVNIKNTCKLSCSQTLDVPHVHEPRCEKTGRRSFRPGPTQIWLYSHKRWLES